MKKWQIFSLCTVLGAAGVAAFLIEKKKQPSEKGEVKTVPEAKLPEHCAEASYSFVSGFHDARTAEVSFRYDSDRFSYKIIEDEFLTYTDVPHVGALYGEDFSMQTEYSDYVGGDDFCRLCESIRAKYKGYEDVSYGENHGCKYYDGDNVCLVLPATEFSYLLITLVKAKGSDIDYTELASHPDIRFILSSVSVA